MPSKSSKQRKYIFALINKYGNKSNTPEKDKWIWDKEWEHIKEYKLISTKGDYTYIMYLRDKYKNIQNTPKDKLYIWEDITKETTNILNNYKEDRSNIDMKTNSIVEKEKWAKDVNIKKGQLHKDLGIPEDEKIPVSLINAIMNAEVGTTITNPTQKGNKNIKVTSTLKKRAGFAKNVRKDSVDFSDKNMINEDHNNVATSKEKIENTIDKYSLLPKNHKKEFIGEFSNPMDLEKVKEEIFAMDSEEFDKIRILVNLHYYWAKNEESDEFFESADHTNNLKDDVLDILYSYIGYKSEDGYMIPENKFDDVADEIIELFDNKQITTEDIEKDNYVLQIYPDKRDDTSKNSYKFPISVRAVELNSGEIWETKIDYKIIKDLYNPKLMEHMDKNIEIDQELTVSDIQDIADYIVHVITKEVQENPYKKLSTKDIHEILAKHDINLDKSDIDKVLEVLSDWGLNFDQVTESLDEGKNMITEAKKEVPIYLTVSISCNEPIRGWMKPENSGPEIDEYIETVKEALKKEYDLKFTETDYEFYSSIDNAATKREYTIVLNNPLTIEQIKKLVFGTDVVGNHLYEKKLNTFVYFADNQGVNISKRVYGTFITEKVVLQNSQSEFDKTNPNSSNIPEQWEYKELGREDYYGINKNDTKNGLPATQIGDKLGERKQMIKSAVENYFKRK